MECISEQCQPGTTFMVLVGLAPGEPGDVCCGISSWVQWVGLRVLAGPSRWEEMGRGQVLSSGHPLLPSPIPSCFPPPTPLLRAGHCSLQAGERTDMEIKPSGVDDGAQGSGFQTVLF